jgi:hypothetical protein
MKCRGIFYTEKGKTMKMLLFIALFAIALTFSASAADNDPMPTRVLDQGSRITLTVGDTVIPAILNDSTASKDLISRLPYTVRLNRYTHDYCGVMSEPLKYDEDDVHNGWMNGDLAFARDGNYFVMFYADEDISQQYGHQITLGKVNVPLSTITSLPRGSITVNIALAE